MKPTLALDFDGVLHQYTGFRGDTIIDGGPVPGAVEFVQAAQENFDVVIHSARAKTRFGRRAMQAWLKENGFPFVPVTAEKPPAHITLDDRALCFTGTFPDPDDLLRFRPWWKTDPCAACQTSCKGPHDPNGDCYCDCLDNCQEGA